MSFPQVNEAPISKWINQVKQGNRAALENIWSAYSPRLLSIARRQLSRYVATSADEDDLVMSAVWNFYLQARDGRYPDLNDRQALWKLLVAITLNKARALSRKELRRQRLLELRCAAQASCEVASGPELAVQLADHLQYLMQLLDDATLCEVATAKLEGLSNAEIALQIGKAVTTVERKLRVIREIWSAHQN
jgi:DNA-directed RNA polymerase specialized sigma24 family protein